MSTYGYLSHHGILGMRWGIRRYQNADGTLTAEGRARYGSGSYKKENSPEQTFKEIKSLYEGEKSGNIKNVFNKYFDNEPQAQKIKEYTKQLEDQVKQYRDEWNRIAFKTNDIDANGEIATKSIKDAAKTIDKETHPDGVYSLSKEIYVDDIYDYLVDSYAKNLEKKYPKLKELETKLTKTADERTKVMTPFIENIVGDIGQEPVYSQKTLFGTISPRFKYVVRDILLSEQNNGFYWNSIKDTVDFEEMVVDDVSKVVKELEEKYKFKVID